jgi:ubiquinone/menaquinone biosynthesis C-methylase UbiE
MPPPAEGIYDADFVRKLFGEMSRTYGTVNLISSFGFCVRWRRQCVALLPAAPGATVYDFMTGQGELCPALAQAVGSAGRVVALDFCAEMCQLARSAAQHLPAASVEVMEADALCSGLPDSSADAIVSCFGLKTLAPAQLPILAREIQRLLRPGGSVAMLEISVPRLAFLRLPYLFYIRRIIPLIGWAMLGNPDNYRHLGIYTCAFGDCRGMCTALTECGLMCEPRSFFWGCATGLVARKPPA